MKTGKISNWAAALSAALLLGIFAAAPSGCSHSIRLGEDVPLEAGAPSFTVPVEAGMVEAGLTSYCPSNKCPAGHTTCPSSRFGCDVNLLADRQNCGACGVACPGPTQRETWECLDGHCVMQSQGIYLDCDGAPDNGAETDIRQTDSCGGCGNKCSSPDKPCVARNAVTAEYGCGCRADQLLCTSFGFPACVDPKLNDQNCGTCGNACDPTGGGRAPVPNAYYGCVGGECGAETASVTQLIKYLKCSPAYGNCDSDPSNGCEADLRERENCGGCGNTCDPGQECKKEPTSGLFMCMCPAGKTFCAGLFADTGTCVDIASDAANCGACGSACSSIESTARFGATAFGVCQSGTCKMDCFAGRADCNGNEGDGCEVNSDSDPRNCGGCGRVCDAVAGQACVGGRCMVEPCDEVDTDAGGPK